jgi:hypothetical protein
VFESILDEIPGGVGLNVARLDYETAGKEYIPAGTPVYVDIATRVAEVCKSALAIDGGGSTTPRLGKDHHFAVGDYLNDGTTGAKITALDKTTSADYDTATVNTALTVTAGTKYQQGTVSGSSVVLLYTPNGMVKSPTRLVEGNADVPVVTIGTYREDALTYPLSAAYKIALRGGTAGTGKSLLTAV